MAGFASLKILDFDHVELAVGDIARAAEAWHRLGFHKVAERQIIERKLRSDLLVQNGIAILLSHSDLSTDPVARFVATHGDGVVGVGLRCEDAVSAFEIAVNRGAEIADPPKLISRDYGMVQQASIRAFGEVRHTFVSREGSLFLEGFDITPKTLHKGFGLSRIDYIDWCIPAEDVPKWNDYYETVFGGPVGVMRVSCGQNREFLEVNHGPGVQKIAFATDDILETTRALRKEGVKFFQVPSTYYDTLPALADRAPKLQELGILVDGDAEKYLLHTFTECAGGALAFEIVERHGDEGFGEANRTRLSEALEKYKSRRGVLD